MVRHPLDPSTPSRRRDRVITLDEPRKQDLIPYLEAKRLGDLLPTPPNRKAYAYFHTLGDQKFHRGIVNITTNSIEVNQILKGIQGRADTDD
ncbi:Amine oxidase [Fusarium keratoplasticum]|nr:Amine oxidase [Fusarium keratoplasticum]